MKYFHPFLSVIFGVAFLVLVYTKNGISEDNICYLKSNTENLHVSVYEYLPDGTIGRRILNSVLEEDQRILLKSEYEKIYYEYNNDPELPSSVAMGFIRSCKEKETFTLP